MMPADMATHEELLELVELMETHRRALELRIAQQNVIVNAAVALVEVTQVDISNSDEIDKALSDLVRAVSNRHVYSKPDENVVNQ